MISKTIIAVLALAQCAGIFAQGTLADYKRVYSLYDKFNDGNVYNSPSDMHWKDSSNVFGYAIHTPNGERFTVINAENKVKKVFESRDSMNSILTYMEELNQYDTTDVAPTVHAVEQYNVMREDVPHQSFTNEEALMNAPEKEDGYFKVPKII